MVRFAAFLLAAPLVAFGATFPPYASLPKLPIANEAVEVESYGQAEFVTRAKPELVRGKRWTGSLVYAPAWGDEAKNALSGIVKEMEKGGWQVMYRDEPRNPPLATLKLARDAREAWANVEVFSEAVVTIVERGMPTKIQLESPRAGIEKVADTADFPFLKRFPGSKLAQTVRDDRPLLIEPDDKGPVQVASGAVTKEYQSPGIGKLEVVVAYREALKAAGWQVVEESTGLTQGDPFVTARYSQAPLDLWVRVRSPGERYEAIVGDAGGERAPSRLKAELDRKCKVPVYGVNFDFDKASLRADSEAALASILKLLSDYGDLAIELGGHTDNVGQRPYNLRLSEARVNTVRGWLVGKGVKADRLTARGYADTQPLAENDTPEGRARNRRVELKKPGC